MNTAEFIVKTLEEVGVRYVFGIPGGALEDFNTALYNSGKIHPIVTKHEEGAAFMADGFARVSGQLGVCCSTAGPGATNLITGVATANGDSISILALTGQEALAVSGKGAIQESGFEGINLANIFSNFTKYNGTVVHERRAQYMLDKALRVARAAPSGAVHLTLPPDVMKKEVDAAAAFVSPMPRNNLCDREAVREAAKRLVAAKQPLIIAGWGTALSRGAKNLLDLAELLEIPVATSPKAKGIFPESHPLSLGVLGFAGAAIAKHCAFAPETDLILAVGTSFNELTTNGWDPQMAQGRQLIQVDADPEKIGRNYPLDLALLGDAATNLKELALAVKELLATAPASLPQTGQKHQAIRELKEKLKGNDDSFKDNPDGLYHPQRLIEDVQKSFPDNSVFFADMGNNMAWAIRYLAIDQPYSFFTCLGFSSMGYAVAAPVGAKLAVPERPVVALVGDGSFLMNGFEVATAVNYNIPVVWVVFNNAMLGMVYHGRKMFTTPVPEGIPSRFQRVDFVKVAEGLGARGIRLGKGERLTQALVDDILAAGQPTVLDVWIDEEAVPPIHSRIKTVDKHFS